jgi:hypothetical protein
VLSDPRGLFSNSRQPSSSSALGVSEDLSVISNSLHCLTLASPKDVQYHGEYLTFTSDDLANAGMNRQLDGSKHGIYLMIQLTHLIIDHFEAFRPSSGDPCVSLPGSSSGSSSSNQQRRSNEPEVKSLVATGHHDHDNLINLV